MPDVKGVNDSTIPAAERHGARSLSSRPVLGFAVAIAAVGGSVLIRFLLEPYLGWRSPYITFFPAVAVGVFLARAAGGLVATFFSLLAINFFFVEPRFVFGTQGRADGASVVLFLFGAGVIIWLGEAMHRARERSETLRLEARNAEKRAREIVETANEGIWLLDAQGLVLMVNARLCEMLGYTPEEMIGCYKWHFVSPEEVSAARGLFEHRREGISEQADLRFRSKRGEEVWIRMAARPRFDAAGRFAGALDMFTDISDRKKLEQELEDKIAERTARLQEIVKELEVFSYSIAHDLRAPLRAMQGISMAVLEDYSHLLPEEGRDLLARIAASAKLMDRQVLHVLEYNRLLGGDLPMEDIDLEDLIGEVLCYPDLQLAHQYIVLETGIPSVRGNRLALTQVVSNLLSNAVKFVAPGRTPAIRIRAEPGGDSVRVCVKDNGIGISLKGQQKIFGLFQRLHQAESYDGTGIGLAIVKIAVERMGGAVGVNSEPGQGSEFWIQLKMAESVRARQAAQPTGDVNLPSGQAASAGRMASGSDLSFGQVRAA